MDLEIVTVGTELLLGFTIDSNTADIAWAVTAVGGHVVRRTSVGDDRPAIRDAVASALSRTRFVVVTGGLGPTTDDVTKRAVADLMGAPLELDEDYLLELERRFERYGRGPLPPSNRSQAEIPRGARVLPNRRGTAPGLVLESGEGTVVLLPGVPPEMRLLVQEYVVPLIRERLEADGSLPKVTRSLQLRTTGITESGLVSLIGDAAQAVEGVALAYLPGLDGVDLRLTVREAPPDEAARLLELAATVLRPLLGTHCYGIDQADLAAIVLERLRTMGLTLAVAESCTGGLLGARLTAIPGSSDVFVGGITAYANETKRMLLGVPAAQLDEHGAASGTVALAMACGVRERLRTGAGIAVTGIAGPTGGTAEKPVGTVWVAAVARDLERAARLRLPGGREEVRYRSAQAALNLMRTLVSEP